MRATPILRVILVVGGMLAVLAAVVAMVLSMHTRASAEWAEFSIGPPAGVSSSIDSRAMVRSDGITLKSAVALAYDVPAVRIIGPADLLERRYSLTAVLGDRATTSFRSLLKTELDQRFRLETHVERRSFDIFVLGAADASRLMPADGLRESIWIQQSSARFEDTSMDALAGALQGILGRPVLDETGLTGLYDLEFGWNEDRVSSVTAVLRDRFGLQLSPGTREMDALIVDRIQRDPALVLLDQIGRASRIAPPSLRRQISRLIHTH